MKKLLYLFLVLSFPLFLITGCDNESSEAEPKGTIKIGITDTRVTTPKSTNNIIDPSKLTKFELAISKIELIKNDGSYILALNQETKIDLRNYQGAVKELVALNTPLGSFTGINIYLSGISISYDGNTYTASISMAPEVTVGALPGYTFSTEVGVPNTFEAEVKIPMPFNFEITNDIKQQNFNINLDAVASCFETEFPCAICPNAEPQKFVALRPVLQLGIYFEEGIQQIMHTPPLDIKYNGGTADYHGIHTFMDFNGIGGTINSHTSQHVYRGTDGVLIVDAQEMYLNTTPLTPNTINATGNTDVRADEIFDFDAFGAELKTKGYTLESGKVYYFSLRKTWNITSDGNTYDLTRMCEPIAVYWP